LGRRKKKLRPTGERNPEKRAFKKSDGWGKREIVGRFKNKKRGGGGKFLGRKEKKRATFHQGRERGRTKLLKGKRG